MSLVINMYRYQVQSMLSLYAFQSILTYVFICATSTATIMSNNIINITVKKLENSKRCSDCTICSTMPGVEHCDLGAKVLYWSGSVPICIGHPRIDLGQIGQNQCRISNLSALYMLSTVQYWTVLQCAAWRRYLHHHHRQSLPSAVRKTILNGQDVQQEQECTLWRPDDGPDGLHEVNCPATTTTIVTIATFPGLVEGPF